MTRVAPRHQGGLKYARYRLAFAILTPAVIIGMSGAPMQHMARRRLAVDAMGLSAFREFEQSDVEALIDAVIDGVREDGVQSVFDAAERELPESLCEISIVFAIRMALANQSGDYLPSTRNLARGLGISRLRFRFLVDLEKVLRHGSV